MSHKRETPRASINGESEMTRQQQIADMETELHPPLTPARRKDLMAMIRIARRLAANGR